MIHDIVTEEPPGTDLSLSQLDIYIDQALHPSLPLYNVGGYVVLQEAIDQTAFAAAFQDEMARHDTFRLRFAMPERRPVQLCDAALPVIALHDFSTAPDPTAAADAWLQTILESSFDLVHGPLHHSALVKIGPRQYRYCAVAHHLIIDGWGFGLWVRKLVAAYLARTGRGPAPEPPPRTFLESIARRTMRGIARDGHRRPSELAPSWPLPLFEEGSGKLAPVGSARVVRELAPARIERLAGFAQSHGHALHHLLAAVLYGYFSLLKERYSWTIGLPSHNRRGEEKAIVGSFVGVSPCLLTASKDDDIVALMDMVKRAMKGCAGRGELSLTGMTRDANAGGARAGKLFDIQFNYMKLDYQTDIGQLETATVYLPNAWAQTPFSLNVCAFGSHQPMQLQIDVNQAYFSAAEAEAIFDRLAFMADQVMADSTLPLAALDMLPCAERQRLALLGGHSGSAALPRQDLAGLFAAACSRNPDAPALRMDDQTISYGQLHGRAQRLARWLEGRNGPACKPLAVCMRPSVHACVALLATALLRRPSVYLDPASPPQRLGQILADAAPELVMTDAHGAARLHPLDWPLADLTDAAIASAIDGMPAAPVVLAPPGDPARIPGWIIYTSGSTGQPKGTVLPQAAILRLASAPNFMRLDAQTVWLQTANPAFDMAMFEIWGTWLNGGTLVLPPKQGFDLDTLTATVARCGVNTLWLTAGLFDKWVGRLAELPACLEFVLAGGDVVPVAAVRKLLALRPGITFINGYGPTENGVFSACAVISDPAQLDESVPIGTPVNGTRAYVVGPGGRLLPFGEAGELWVGGSGLASGYLNAPALTAEKFLAPPGGAVNERIYRTGDRVRWRADGQLAFLGRLDDQVKIRGFRIETGEIEHCLRRHAAVTAAAVVAAGAGAADKHLHAFVSCGGTAAAAQLAELVASELPALLRRHLPDYMLPAQITHVHALPLNANGKVDRKALAQTALADGSSAAARLPASATEAELWSIWQRVLRVPPHSTVQHFLACGGHSLAAMELVAEINARFGVALSVGDVLHHANIVDQAALVDACAAGNGAARPALVRAPRPEAIPMSSVQQQMWLSHQLQGASHEYNVPGAFRLRGPLDVRALGEALRALAARHQTLACVVDAHGGVACMRAIDPAQLVLQQSDLSALPENVRAPQVAAAVEQERLLSFDLAREPAMRARLLTLAPDDHLFLLTFHHIAIDGWSLATICTELAQLYRALRGGGEAALPALDLAYHDFALYEEALAASAGAERSQAFWRARLDGAPVTHALPLDTARPEHACLDGRMIGAMLGPQAAARLDQLAQRHAVSLFTVLQTALALTVGEYGGERDVLVGTPVSGRHDARLFPQVGCYINTLVTRTRYQGDACIGAVIAASQRDWNDSLVHHALPFTRVLEAVAPVRSRGVHPLFQLWFVLQGQEPGLVALDGIDVERVCNARANTKFDLMVSAVPGAAGLQIEWLYRDDLFADASMARLLDAYLQLLHALPDVLDVPVRQLATRLGLAAPALAVAMQTGYNRAECLAERVLRHAADTPDALALTDGVVSLSHGGLAQQVRRLGDLLRESGVGAGDVVGLCADRSIGGVIALLAIQLLGAAYLPLDPQLPLERAAFMLEDAGAVLLLTYRSLMAQLPAAADVVLLDGAGAPDWLADYSSAPATHRAVDPDLAAYLIYTSGSSGTPKAVRVSRANLAHYVHAMAERHAVGGPLRYAVNSAFHTDLGNTSLYLGLWFGGSLHLMAPEAMLDGEAVGKYVRAQRIDVMKITPGHFAALCDDALYAPPLPARALIFGGEVLHGELLRAIAPACVASGCKVINHYGPTEATIGCLTCELDLGAPPVVAPLGLPLPGESVQVMADGVPVARGAWGELVVAGPAVSLGYHRRPELTAAVFFAVPDSGGVPVRHYRTGDRVRINAAGLIEFGGRLDDQIKLRGFRIELAEIDSCLLRVPRVRQAVTIFYKDDAAQDALASFLVADDEDVGAAESALRRTLPEYMVPKRVLALARMPLLGNGKPDRRALAGLLAGQARGPWLAPAGTTETGIAAVMCDLLKIERISADQRFFEAGGNSLLVTRLANELGLRMGLHIPVNLLMANHSVRSLAELADALAVATRPQATAGDMVEIEI